MELWSGQGHSDLLIPHTGPFLPQHFLYTVLNFTFLQNRAEICQLEEHLKACYVLITHRTLPMSTWNEFKRPELDFRCYYFKRFSAGPLYKVNSHYFSLMILKYTVVFRNFRAQWPLGGRGGGRRVVAKSLVFFFSVSLSATAKNSCNTAVT